MSAAPQESKEPKSPVAPAAALGPPSVLSTLNEDGSRRWLMPRLSAGRFWHRRRAVAYALILVFTAIPYLSLNGKPLVLLDVASRHFTIFGYTFLPTDTLLLALFMLSVFVTIFLATALLGRVWCGWACPQTVYLEFVYRPIERLFEGAPGRTRRGGFRGSPLAKAFKYACYFAISCYLAHTFLAYFVGVEQLRQWITRSPFEHPTAFLVMAAVTGLMMFDFTFFREQTCLVACPYGRFQSVLLDRNSLIVSYDARRGEPRGKKSRSQSDSDISLPVLGDCIDCHMCVTTCPTGIDIRNGLQMECVHCTQCIDACDSIMDKVGRPRGLIRYSSQAALSGEPFRWLRPRVIVYPAILTALLSAFVIVLATQSPLDITVLRGRGAVFTLNAQERAVSNQVNVKLVNRTATPRTIRIEASGVEGASLRAEGLPATLRPGESRTLPAQVFADVGAFGPAGGSAIVTLTIADDQGYRRSVPFRMAGPASAPGPLPAKETP